MGSKFRYAWSQSFSSLPNLLTLWFTKPCNRLRATHAIGDILWVHFLGMPYHFQWTSRKKATWVPRFLWGTFLPEGEHTVQSMCSKRVEHARCSGASGWPRTNTESVLANDVQRVDRLTCKDPSLSSLLQECRCGLSDMQENLQLLTLQSDQPTLLQRQSFGPKSASNATYHADGFSPQRLMCYDLS